MHKLKKIIQKETVLSVASILAVLSMFLVHPDASYAGYIDFRTLAILFSLMTVMAGLQKQGLFDRMGCELLAHTGSTLQLTIVLTGLCFFFSMLITNDVALITFVPFTFAVLGGVGERLRRKLTIPVVCMQTIAANLGSMLTPVGNPQNLYLYGKSGMSMASFLMLMLPYTAASFLLLLLWALLLCGGKKEAFSAVKVEMEKKTNPDSRKIIMYLCLFFVCLLTVVRILPYGISFFAVLLIAGIADRDSLKRVDYSLLLTFVAFFIFIGNLGRVPAFSSWLQQIISGREVLVAVFASQVISNVPAALLLSGFTENVKALIIGTDLGGLGTLIASMASLISFRQIARQIPEKKGAYFLLFTISNFLFLAILLGVWMIISNTYQ